MSAMNNMTTTSISEAFAEGAGATWLDDFFPIAIILFITVFYAAGGIKTTVDVIKQHGKKDSGEMVSRLITAAIGIGFILIIFSMF